MADFESNNNCVCIYKIPDCMTFIQGVAHRQSLVFLDCNCTVNPFLPTGQFMAHKLIILIKCFIDILFFKVLI